VKKIPKRLLILSGPSCVGKGPLRSATRKYHPELEYAEPVICHSRAPRLKRSTGTYEIHGLDYYFLPRGLFEQMDPGRFLVVKIRTEYQAVDLVQLGYLFQDHDLVLIEAYPTLAKRLVTWAKKQKDPDILVKTVFLTPLSEEEIARAVEREGKSPETIVFDIMREKLIRRGEDPPGKIEERAKWAFREMQYAKDYDLVIVNHAGEDDVEAWSEPLSQEARRVLTEFARILHNWGSDSIKL
jgi:guanylate kinase